MDNCDKGFSWDDYRTLLRAFQSSGYTFCSYSDIKPEESHVVLRHDIDFSLEAALDIARIESDLGISAHYYVLLRTDFYNLCSPSDWEVLNKIQSLGHSIGLHFDASLYEGSFEVLDVAAAKECDVLEALTSARVETISFHRPSKVLQGLDRKLAGRLHTYLPRFFNDIAYYSDSQGLFRFGHPLDSEAFSKRKAIQLLTHPIWWTPNHVADRIKLLDVFLEKRFNVLRQAAIDNCKPYAVHILKEENR
jgi:hypothetical protein